MSRFEAAVPDSLGNVRADRAVAMLTGVSRAEAAALVEGGRVSVDGRTLERRSALVGSGAVLAVELRHAAGLVADPSVPVTVVHEDAELVVVDKAGGVVVHPGAGNHDRTLVAGIVARYPEMATVGDDPLRPGVVHRLDKGTSGLLVFARTELAFRSLVSQMASRSVGRAYVALVRGWLQDEAGIVDAPIGRSARTPTKMAVSSTGRPARTAYRVLERLEVPEGPVTLIRCELETGRTHQIRVHLAAIGHPVVGDERYGRRSALLPRGRLYLHACELSVDHPSTGERLSWSSELPGDLDLS